MLNSAANEICSAYKKKLNTSNLHFSSCAAELSMKFFLLINIKMPTTVGILIFISRKNIMLNCVECEKSFITLGPNLCLEFLSIWVILVSSMISISIFWCMLVSLNPYLYILLYIRHQMFTLALIAAAKA